MVCALKCVLQTETYVETGGAQGIDFCNAFSLGLDESHCVLGVRNHGVKKEVASTDQSMVPGGTFGIIGMEILTIFGQYTSFRTKN